MFARHKMLSGKTLQEFLPRRVGPGAQDVPSQTAIAKWDVWAAGVNKQMAQQEKVEANV